MNSPRSGFRRAAAASWALTGLGIAGVAGASALAYADTPPPPKAPVVAVDPAPPEVIPTPVPAPPPVPDVPATTVDPPPVTSEPTVQQAPEPQYTPVPEYTTQAPKPRATTPPTTKHRLTPTTVMAPNYSPPVTISRGS